MTAPVFVDTNVFLYARDGGQPAKQQRALEWLERLWRDQSGRTSMQVLSEYYVNLTRKVKPLVLAEDAWEDVHALLAWNPRAIDAALMQRAREVERRFRLSWWDSLVVAAAQAEDCAILLTEDLQDEARFGQVAVLDPFSYRVEEAPAAHAALPALSPRHRGRGRPRKRAA